MKNAVLRIGVSGHQSLGDEETERFVAQSIREPLLAYRQKASDVVLYASLALGADRLFVKIALDLGISVEIVIPCSTYEDLFLSTRDEYNNLLRIGRGSAYPELTFYTHSPAMDNASVPLLKQG
jgi:hypothetical protein